MGMVQSIVSAVVDVVPPLIPPPVWNNMPLPCAPMITGARLLIYLVFGCALAHAGGEAIIASAQFSTRSLWPTSQSRMSLMPCWMVQVPWEPIALYTFCSRSQGYIAGFPNTYAGKVGKTSDALYKGRPCSCEVVVVCFVARPFSQLAFRRT